MKTVTPTTNYADYMSAWEGVVRSGRRHWNMDTWAGQHRYLSLTALVLTAQEVQQLRMVTQRFGPLIDRAVNGILEDRDWWSALAWPWAAIELARQEPPHPGGYASLFGRFDCLLDHSGNWQAIEFNADTPSGGREATGLEAAIGRLYPGLHGSSARLSKRLTESFRARMNAGVVGIVSSHRWLEDMAQAHWLATLLRKEGLQAIVGDVNDLTVEHRLIHLRGQRIDALYRFYPVERFYRQAIFASLCEASIDGRLLMLNGLRVFLAQSKACLAWLWSNRGQLAHAEQDLIEQHLPATYLARDPHAARQMKDSVVKHVNGREGDSVVFGSTLSSAQWEERLLEGGYVVQRTVHSPQLVDVDIDDLRKEVRYIGERVACVGAFSVGGRFAGCYTRLDGPVTSPAATFVATLRGRT